MTDKKSITGKWIRAVLTIAYFYILFVVQGIAFLGDSGQYMNMHPNREPLYPLFLKMIEAITTEQAFYPCLGIIQNSIAIVGVWYLLYVVQKVFPSKEWMKFVNWIFVMLPYIVTPLFSETGFSFPNAILSEALTLPLFYIFIGCILQIMFSEKRGSRFAGLFLAFLLSLTRAQMLTAFILWAIACGYAIWNHSGSQKRILQTGLIALMVFISIPTRTMLIKGYNQVVRGRYISNTYGKVQLLTNFLYNADREDRELIADSEQQLIFDRMMDKIEEMEAGYQSAPQNLSGRIAHLEKQHDIIKFQIIEGTLKEYYEGEKGVDDYVDLKIIGDQTSEAIMKSVMFEHVGRWFINYLLLGGNGLIRTIAVVHPLFSPVAILLYLLAILGVILVLRKDRKNKAGIWMLFVLLSIFGNVYGTAMTIMCLSRYMIYNFPLFYMAGLFISVEMIKIYGAGFFKIPQKRG